METESKGVRLKKIRLEKGLSLEEVQKKTKIHLDVLKAIEEDNFINLSPIYVKGFLKIYCKFLDVDYKDYASDAKAAQPEPVVQPSPRKEEVPLFIKNTPEKRGIFKPRINLKAIFAVLAAIVILFGLFSLGKGISRRIAHKAESKPKITKAEKPVPARKGKEKVVKERVRTESVIAEKNASDIRLVISAKEDCWIQLKVDGRLVFQNILKKGRFENWKAKDKIELSLGNAGGIDLEVNSKVISPLGRRGQVLKNITITKNGLSIPQ